MTDRTEAATEGMARNRYEQFLAAQRAVGVREPVPYGQLSERTRRIQKNQARDATVAALAAADGWDRDHGVVRVDTRDEATVERITRLLTGEFGGTERASALVARAVRCILAADGVQP
jgi:hypothetical protein